MQEVRCGKCGRPYPADQYVLDYRYKMVVCPQCAKEKDPVQKKEPEPQSEIVQKPVEPKEHHAPAMTNSDKIKVRCKKCKFEFKYDNIRKTPARCPYCGAEVIL